MDRPVRWGLLGCGDIAAKRVARAILDAPDSELLAACRRNGQQLLNFCLEFQLTKGVTNETMLFTNPDIDAVYIATPVHLHCPQTIAAAQASKHVLVEKPMARTPDECRQMIDACQNAGVKLGVAYYRRFYPIVRRMKELLASGDIGRPLAVHAATATTFNLQPGDQGYWRVVLAEGGGGSLMDVGSHRINLFLDLLGDIQDVHLLRDTLTGSFEAEDCATLSFRFANGAHGSLQCFFGTSATVDDFTILGTKGRLVASPLNGSKLAIDLGETQRVEDHPPPGNLHGPLVADFVQAIRENREPLVTGDEGLRTNEVMAKAYGI